MNNNNNLNWYFTLKLAQIWKTNYQDSFIGDLKALYEIEYKLSMLKSPNLVFNGLEQRKNNIIKNLESRLNSIIYRLKEPLLDTFAGWLKSHALLDPNLWATERVNKSIEEDGDIGAINSLCREYNIYTNLDEKQQLNEVAGIINPKEIKDILFPGHESDEENHIGDLDITEYYNSLNDFLEVLMEQNGPYAANLMLQIYKDLIFPAWYKKWKAEGIDQTRAKLESIYNNLKNAKDIKSNMIALNYAINAVHQNGSILEYLEEYGGIYDYPKSILHTMDLLSNRSDVSEWNNQLKAIGLQI